MTTPSGEDRPWAGPDESSSPYSPPGYQPPGPQYEQPQYEQPQYGPRQYEQPQYEQPQYGQPQYDTSQYAPQGPPMSAPPYPPPGGPYGAPPPPPPRRGPSTGLWIALGVGGLVLLLALCGGGVAATVAIGNAAREQATEPIDDPVDITPSPQEPTDGPASVAPPTGEFGAHSPPSDPCLALQPAAESAGLDFSEPEPDVSEDSTTYISGCDGTLTTGGSYVGLLSTNGYFYTVAGGDAEEAKGLQDLLREDATAPKEVPGLGDEAYVEVANGRVSLELLDGNLQITISLYADENDIAPADAEALVVDVGRRYLAGV